MRHAVGNVTADGHVYLYVGKPKIIRGWIDDESFMRQFNRVRMGFRRPDGGTYSMMFTQPITDTFEPGGTKPPDTDSPPNPERSGSEADRSRELLGNQTNKGDKS